MHDDETEFKLHVDVRGLNVTLGVALGVCLGVALLASWHLRAMRGAVLSAVDITAISCANRREIVTWADNKTNDINDTVIYFTNTTNNMIIASVSLTEGNLKKKTNLQR